MKFFDVNFLQRFHKTNAFMDCIVIAHDDRKRCDGSILLKEINEKDLTLSGHKETITINFIPILAGKNVKIK